MRSYLDTMVLDAMINGVVFKRSWRDKALALLPDSKARLSFYECLFDLAFDEKDAAPADGAARIMYEMCKDDIRAEIDKYNRTCERNAANAAARYAKSTTRSESQPLAANGSGSQPLADNSNSNSKGNSKGNSNLSPNGEKTGEDREKFDVIGIFFRRGSADPRAEAERFWNYYDALGWKNNKGAAISNKNSAAAMWQMSGEPAPDAAFRALWWRHFHLVGGTPYPLWLDVERFDMVRADEGATMHIYCNHGNRVRELVETQYLLFLKAFAKDCVASSVEYHVRA